MGAEVDYQVAAPSETRTPNLHRANNRSKKSADGRMATEAARLKRKNPLIRKRKTGLTLTGLLMEGLGSAPSVGKPDFLPTSRRSFWFGDSVSLQAAC